MSAIGRSRRCRGNVPTMPRCGAQLPPAKALRALAHGRCPCRRVLFERRPAAADLVGEMIEMTELQRPTRVVVVDADNPLSEVRGEFFWREDHERLLAATRETAYREGYDQGFAAGSSQRGLVGPQARVRRRPHVVARTLAVVVTVAFLVSLIGSLLR